MDKRFWCDESYKADITEYTDSIMARYGISSQPARREIMYLANKGNTVALKFYADMIYYRSILRKYPYRSAFSLYLNAAGISLDDDGNLSCSGHAYPMAFWSVAHYLVDYKRESDLKKSETIPFIEDMPLEERLAMALELAVACVDYEQAMGAVNLIGRILQILSKDEGLYEKLFSVLKEIVFEHDFSGVNIDPKTDGSFGACAALTDVFFEAAADNGYVYACNSLANREADNIINLSNDNKSEALDPAIQRYLSYLKKSADKYEPYAANRLGLFYTTGEIKGSTGKKFFKEYIDYGLGKEYFTKATMYPDANSAWAFFNLIKYYHRDYDTNLALLDEHMGYIQALNSEVYDLAMEL